MVKVSLQQGSWSALVQSDLLLKVVSYLEGFLNFYATTRLFLKLSLFFSCCCCNLRGVCSYLLVLNVDQLSTAFNAQTLGWVLLSGYCSYHCTSDGFQEADLPN
jgi:hypothetical protein